MKKWFKFLDEFKTNLLLTIMIGAPIWILLVNGIIKYGEAVHISKFFPENFNVFWRVMPAMFANILAMMLAVSVLPKFSKFPFISFGVVGIATATCYWNINTILLMSSEALSNPAIVTEMNLTNKEKLLTLTTNWLVITDVFLEGLLVLLSWITIIKSNMILSDTTAPTQSGNSGTGAPTTVTNDPTNGKKFRLPSMKGLFSR